MTGLSINIEPLPDNGELDIDDENLTLLRELDNLVRQVSARSGFGAPEAAMETRRVRSRSIKARTADRH